MICFKCSDKLENCHDMRNTIINEMQCKENLIFILSNHYGIKCVSNLLQLEPCNDIC